LNDGVSDVEKSELTVREDLRRHKEKLLAPMARDSEENLQRNDDTLWKIDAWD